MCLITTTFFWEKNNTKSWSFCIIWHWFYLTQNHHNFKHVWAQIQWLLAATIGPTQLNRNIQARPKHMQQQVGVEIYWTWVQLPNRYFFFVCREKPANHKIRHTDGQTNTAQYHTFTNTSPEFHHDQKQTFKKAYNSFVFAVCKIQLTDLNKKRQLNRDYTDHRI